MSRVAPLGPVDYGSAQVPSLYHCGKCGNHGVKLWREYQTFLENQTLRCGDCACAEQSKDGKAYGVRELEAGRVCVTTTYDAEKQPQLHKIHGGSDVGGDQIGWRIPAVPTEDGSTYWGYTSVPARGVAWWKRIPLRKEPSVRAGAKA
jgi:hypothetical protein